MSRTLVLIRPARPVPAGISVPSTALPPPFLAARAPLARTAPAGLLARARAAAAGCDAPGGGLARASRDGLLSPGDRKSTRLNSSHVAISYAVFCLKKKKK